mgnify:CR=1 FL=1
MKVENFFNSNVNTTVVQTSEGERILGVCSNAQGMSSYIWFSKQQAIDFAAQLVDAALELSDEPSKDSE